MVRSPHMKKQFTPQQKAAVALEALKGEKSVAEISGLYEVHSTQIKDWKNTAKEHLTDLFTDKRAKENRTQERLIEELYRLLGRREAEVAWLKKKLQLDLPPEGLPD